MAQIRLEPPEPFNFRRPDDWSHWKQRFQQFREASGLSEAPATKQISTLLYCLGEEAEAVLTSTNATKDDRADYDRELGKFDSFFQVSKTSSTNEPDSIIVTSSVGRPPNNTLWHSMT